MLNNSSYKNNYYNYSNHIIMDKLLLKGYIS